MKKNTFAPYKGNRSDITLNDYLSIERTYLSVERTHLSYMRTVISMIVAAITLYKILTGIEGLIVAVILLASAAVFYIRGRKVCKAVGHNMKQIEDEDD